MTARFQRAPRKLIRHAIAADRLHDNLHALVGQYILKIVGQLHALGHIHLANVQHIRRTHVLPRHAAHRIVVFKQHLHDAVAHNAASHNSHTNHKYSFLSPCNFIVMPPVRMNSSLII